MDNNNDKLWKKQLRNEIKRDDNNDKLLKRELKNKNIKLKERIKKRW